MLRINEFCHTLVADAIRWTAGPYSLTQRLALSEIIKIMIKGDDLTTDDFLRIRNSLTRSGFNTSPPIGDQHGETD